jgi:hypothetical protein
MTVHLIANLCIEEQAEKIRTATIHDLFHVFVQPLENWFERSIGGFCEACGVSDSERDQCDNHIVASILRATKQFGLTPWWNDGVRYDGTVRHLIGALSAIKITPYDPAINSPDHRNYSNYSNRGSLVKTLIHQSCTFSLKFNNKINTIVAAIPSLVDEGHERHLERQAKKLMPED